MKTRESWSATRYYARRLVETFTRTLRGGSGMQKLMALAKVFYLVTCGLFPLIGLAHSSELHLNLIPAGQALDIASQCTTKLVGDKRIIKSNCIPNHELERFPNRGNPNGIPARNYPYGLPLKPQLAREATVSVRQLFWIALEVVALLTRGVFK